MMQRAQPLWSGSRGKGNNHNKSCCRAKVLFSLATGGAYVAAKTVFADDKSVPHAVLEPIKTVAPATLLPPPPPSQHKKCFLQPVLAAVGLRVATACPFREPVQWALERRDLGTRAVAHSRQWLSSATDPSHTPGVIAAVGAASAVPTLLATLPAPALWFAAASLFTIGAVDSYINLNVHARLHTAEMHTLQLEREAGAVAASSSMGHHPAAVAAHMAQSASVLRANATERALSARDSAFELAQNVPAPSVPWQFVAGAAATVGAAMARKPVRTTSPQRPASTAAAATAASSASGPKLHLLDLSRYLKHNQLSMRVTQTVA